MYLYSMLVAEAARKERERASLISARRQRRDALRASRSRPHTGFARGVRTRKARAELRSPAVAAPEGC